MYLAPRFARGRRRLRFLTRAYGGKMWDGRTDGRDLHASGYKPKQRGPCGSRSDEDGFGACGPGGRSPVRRLPTEQCREEAATASDRSPPPSPTPSEAPGVVTPRRLTQSSGGPGRSGPSEEQ